MAAYSRHPPFLMKGLRHQFLAPLLRALHDDAVRARTCTLAPSTQLTADSFEMPLSATGSVAWDTARSCFPSPAGSLIIASSPPCPCRRTSSPISPSRGLLRPSRLRDVRTRQPDVTRSLKVTQMFDQVTRGHRLRLTTCLTPLIHTLPRGRYSSMAARSRLSDPILKPPSTNEPRHEALAPRWLRCISYPRASLSSLCYNVAAIAMFAPAARPNPFHTPSGTAAPILLAFLLHAMGVLSLANWTARTELWRLLDISCMLVLKAYFIAVAAGWDVNDATMLVATVISTLASTTAVFGARVADGGAGRVMAPVIAVLLATEYIYFPAKLLVPLEGSCIFVLGYLCKLADDLRICPRFYWWTALFHVGTAYSMYLAGISERGAHPGHPTVLWF